MALIDYTYFQKRLTAVPNLNQPEIESGINDYIDIYEDEYLVKVLGQELKDEFIIGLEATTPDQKWLDLRDGVEFEYNGIKYKWKGFQRSTKESPIAYYVMWHYVRDDNDYFTGIGTAKPVSENSNIVSPMERMTNIYSRMVDDNRILALYLYSNRDIYPTYKLLNCGYYPFYYTGYYPHYEWYDYKYCATNDCDVLTAKINIYGI